MAIATPPGASRRGMVRISGPQALALVEGTFDADTPRRLCRAVLDVGGLRLPVLAMMFQGPRSYSGQDTLELQMPGNPVLLERVVEGLLASGRRRDLDVRRAERGEFTARAYLNGRMSLLEAEGVAAAIAAHSDGELRAARMLMDGRLGAWVRGAIDALATALALVEAGIDFTDQDDVPAIAPQELLRRLRPIHGQIEAIVAGAVGTERLEAIPWVVLSGRTNAGKSTLFNALLGHERAVVSDLPGTTRDVLSEPLTINTERGPAEVMLMDVAGEEDVTTAVSRSMQEAAGEARRRAELVLHCVPLHEDDPDAAPPPALLVRTKGDLGAGPAGGAARGLVVSAVSGAGLEDLRTSIADRLADRAVSLAADAVALRPRHEAALRAAETALQETIALADRSAARGSSLPDPELVAAGLRAALGELGALGGQVTPEDVLGRIFATFCIGK